MAKLMQSMVKQEIKEVLAEGESKCVAIKL